MKRRDRGVMVAVAVGAALLGFGLMAYVFSERQASPAGQRAGVTQDSSDPATRSQAQPAASPAETPFGKGDGDNSLIPALLETDQPQQQPQPKASAIDVEAWPAMTLRILWRLSLAALLAAVLAFRRRKDLGIIQRNLYVAQTQILLAVVASSLMMVVGDNAARAFGIFAAVSLVRFRTNIRDPKEITVLLLSLSIGLATGVGRWELAIILTVFVMPLLWLLERGESEQVYRAMELTIKTRNTDATQEALKVIFKRHGMTAEVRQIDPPDEKEPVGCIMYHVNMALNVSTDAINEQILAAAPPQEVEAIEWEQQKSTGYAYN
jgi:uncharacterized membrane protein YhiD involved in acid resistance